MNKLINDKDVAIVLGGTNPHIELIKQLQNRGYYVILVDYLKNPPASKYADLHIVESTMDKEKVLEIAKQHNAKLVISACVDQANITACYVAEKLKLTKPYSYELASNITNKGFMKKVMIENSIPTTKYCYLEKDEEIKDLNLSFPIMVKPADACAASGVKKANNEVELKEYLENAKKISRTGRTVIEEFFNGMEVSVYCFIDNYDSKILMISERKSIIEGEKKVLKCYATVTPPIISETAMRKMKDAINKIAKAFDLNNTPLHVQVLINNDDIDIIEFAPRVGGGISFETIRNKTGFDIINATIDSYLEKRVIVGEIENNFNYCVVNIIYAYPGIFDRLEGTDKLIKDGIIDSVHFHKTKGMEIGDSNASGGRIAAIVIHGDTMSEIYEKIKCLINNIEVYDNNNNSILRKDLYLRKD